MRHPNLRSFLETLKREGELCVIEEPVNPFLELAEIQRRVVARQGPALLFTNVTGSPFPVTTNLFGASRRFEPAADIHAKDAQLQRYHVSLSAPVIFDCRIKPWFPPIVEPLPETVARVDALWPRIFPGTFTRSTI